MVNIKRLANFCRLIIVFLGNNYLINHISGHAMTDK